MHTHEVGGQPEPPARSRRFPGTPDQSAAARHWIGQALPAGPQLDDLLTVVGELTANAVRHTRSGHPGGKFTVTLARHPGFLRLAVTDQGSPSAPEIPAATDGTSGLGLRLVSELARRWRVTGDETGRTVRADLPWTGQRPEPEAAPARGRIAHRTDPVRPTAGDAAGSHGPR